MIKRSRSPGNSTSRRLDTGQRPTRSSTVTQAHRRRLEADFAGVGAVQRLEDSDVRKDRGRGGGQT